MPEIATFILNRILTIFIIVTLALMLQDLPAEFEWSAYLSAVIIAACSGVTLHFFWQPSAYPPRRD